MLQEIIRDVISGNDLGEKEAYDSMNEIMQGKATDSQIGGFLIALRIKGETVQEITGFARAMRDNALPLKLDSLSMSSIPVEPAEMAEELLIYQLLLQ